MTAVICFELFIYAVSKYKNSQQNTSTSRREKKKKKKKKKNGEIERVN